MTEARTIAAAVLGSIGLAASLSGVVGIIRMPDLYTRVQCATKNVTLGALPMLAAVVLIKGPITQYGSRALLIAFLLLVASPTASYALVRAAYRVGVPMWEGAVAAVPAARRQRRERDNDAERTEQGEEGS